MSQGDGGGNTPVAGADGAGGRRRMQGDGAGEKLNVADGGAGAGVLGGMLGGEWEAQRRWKWPRGRVDLIGGDSQSKSESQSESESDSDSESVQGEKKLRRVAEAAAVDGVAEARKVCGTAQGLSVRVGFGRRVGAGEIEVVMTRLLGS